MKVSELSQRAGVPLPTIKFYIREGLLPAGERTGRNQAEYSEEHLERLALIRALRDDAGLGIAAIGRALRASAEDVENSVPAALDALESPDGPPLEETSEEFSAARAEVSALIAAQGWAIEPDSSALREAARALSIIRRSFRPTGGELAPYAQAMMQIARHELPTDWRSPEAPNAALRYGVLGTVLFEPFILALRRMAHIARSEEIKTLRGS